MSAITKQDIIQCQILRLKRVYKNFVTKTKIIITEPKLHSSVYRMEL